MDFDERVIVKSEDIECEGILIRKVKSNIKGTSPDWWYVEIKKIIRNSNYDFKVGEVLLFEDKDVFSH